VYCKKPYITNLDQLKEKDDESLFIKDVNKYCFNNKIRWSNMGFQYDWTNRTYPDQKTQLPSELFKLCEETKNIFKKIIMGIEDFNPESVIINYYGEKDYMGGHLDDGEKDQDSPIISFSIGCSCIFLMGGYTKDSEPIPLILETGDLFIMSGNSRKCFHGVPRIIENSFDNKQFLDVIIKDDIKSIKIQDDFTFSNNDSHALYYLQNHRLNFNFRKVIPSY